MVIYLPCSPCIFKEHFKLIHMGVAKKLASNGTLKPMGYKGGYHMTGTLPCVKVWLKGLYINMYPCVAKRFFTRQYVRVLLKGLYVYCMTNKHGSYLSPSVL